MRLLHVVPRWIGGGPERHLLAWADLDEALGAPFDRRLLVLDRPLSTPMFLRARRLGLTVLQDAAPATVAAEIAAADVVEITFWNHPLLLDLLRSELPEMRLAMRLAVAGDTVPQILVPHVADMADLLVPSAPRGYGVRLPRSLPAHVAHVPALADMTRLTTHQHRPGSGRRVGMLGTLSPAKLHPAFVDIVAHLTTPGVSIHAFGRCEDEHEQRLRAALRERGIEDRVDFLGHVEDVGQALGGVDIFAHPLAPGGYATSEKALQEAMWVGLPPVVMRGTAATGWIEHGVTGFIADDPRAFAHALDALAQDPHLQQQIGAAARAYARQMFEPSTNARTLNDLMQRTFAAPKRQRTPLPGSSEPGSARFLQSLGPQASAFLAAVERREMAARTGVQDLEVDARFRSAIFLHGEGGLAHYANTYREDLKLRAWLDILREDAG